MYRVLVTGGRDHPEAEVIWVPLWTLVHKHQSMVLVHGACPTGADLYAHEWVQLPGQSWNRRERAHEKGLDRLVIEEAHPADWERYGKSAGPRRNEEMVRADADICLAFPTPKSNGTWDCVARAWVRGIDVYVFHHLQVGRFHQLSDAQGEKLAKEKLHWAS